MTENEKVAEQGSEVAVLYHAERRLKVTKMDRKSVAVAMEKVRQEMGGLQSRYGQALLEQRNRLMKEAQRDAGLKKAA